MVRLMRALATSLFAAIALLPLTTTAAPTIVVGPGTSPAGGYLPLSLFGVAPIAGVGDETINNIIVPSFEYAGQSWTEIGVVSNGYVVVGGGTAADVTFINSQLPSNTAPANILAPFWTDLNPAFGGAIRVSVLTDGADDWIVVDWESVRNFADPFTNSFQVWIGVAGDAHPGEDITFTYGAVSTGDLGFLTVGAQDVTGTVGDTYYRDGVGTLPTNGTQLRVTSRDMPVPQVPEPATLALLGLGLAGIAASLRRKLS